MPTSASLFSGIGVPDWALQNAGFEVRWQCENDSYCASQLERRWPKLTRYGDIREVDWSGAETVDVLWASWPCQSVSTAGKRLGSADSRWLWPEVARCLAVVRPRVLIGENVAAHLTIDRGWLWGEVLADLASLGFDARWQVLRSSDFGAPHSRARVILVATDTDHDGRGWDISNPSAQGCQLLDKPFCNFGPGDQPPATNPDFDGFPRLEEQDGLAIGWDDGNRDDLDRYVASLAHATGPRCEGEGRSEPPESESERATDWGPYEPAIRRWERILGRPAPFPTDDHGKLNPRLPEWMLGLPLDFIGGKRNPQLHALGNSVQYQLAEWAVQWALSSVS